MNHPQIQIRNILENKIFHQVSIKGNQKDLKSTFSYFKNLMKTDKSSQAVSYQHKSSFQGIYKFLYEREKEEELIRGIMLFLTSKNPNICFIWRGVFLGARTPDKGFSERNCDFENSKDIPLHNRSITSGRTLYKLCQDQEKIKEVFTSLKEIKYEVFQRVYEYILDDFNIDTIGRRNLKLIDSCLKSNFDINKSESKNFRKGSNYYRHSKSRLEKNTGFNLIEAFEFIRKLISKWVEYKGLTPKPITYHFYQNRLQIEQKFQISKMRLFIEGTNKDMDAIRLFSHIKEDKEGLFYEIFVSNSENLFKTLQHEQNLLSGILSLVSGILNNPAYKKIQFCIKKYELLDDFGNVLDRHNTSFSHTNHRSEWLNLKISNIDLFPLYDLAKQHPDTVGSVMMKLADGLNCDSYSHIVEIMQSDSIEAFKYEPFKSYLKDIQKFSNNHGRHAHSNPSYERPASLQIDDIRLQEICFDLLQIIILKWVKDKYEIDIYKYETDYSKISKIKQGEENSVKSVNSFDLYKEYNDQQNSEKTVVHHKAKRD